MDITAQQGWTAAKVVERNFANLSSDEQVQLANFVNVEIFNIVKKMAPAKLVTNASISVNVGFNTIAVESDFKDMSTEGMGIFKLDVNGQPQEELAIISRGDTSREGFYREGSNWIINSNTTQTLKQFYTPTITQLTALTDSFTTVDQDHLELIRMGLLYQWAIFARNPIKQNNYSIQYEALKESFGEEIQSTADTGETPVINY